MGQRGTLWAIILAGGEGRRLAPLTESLHGVALPKQFATVIGEGSLLQQTVARISPLVPPRRMVAVVPAAYAELAAWQRDAPRASGRFIIDVWQDYPGAPAPSHPATTR
jgi:mannose-1-phosphate guanylyltransferase